MNLNRRPCLSKVVDAIDIVLTLHTHTHPNVLQPMTDGDISSNSRTASSPWTDRPPSRCITSKVF